MEAFSLLICVKGEGGGGGDRKKGKNEVGRKEEGIGERRKGTPAMITPFCSPLPLLTVASANCDWLIRQ